MLKSPGSLRVDIMSRNGRRKDQLIELVFRQSPATTSFDQLGPKESVTLHSNPGISAFCNQSFPIIHCSFTALKSRNVALKSRTKFGESLSGI